MERIRFEHITKTFGSVVANHDISFSINKGEVFSILGENGSGKTTLLNVLAGIYQQDEGRLFIDGKEADIKSPKDAYSYGIGMVHQHFKLVKVFTAVENIALGLTIQDYKFILNKYVDDPALLEKYKNFTLKNALVLVKMMCDKYGFNINMNRYVYEMSISEKQNLEIIKALFRGVETLILDEPTAVLTPQEISRLFSIVKNMKEDGKTIIIITHKLNEVMEVSDRVAILRKGEYIQTLVTKETNETQLAEMMVGRKIDLDIHRSDIKNTGVRLEIRNLCTKNRDGKHYIEDINFDLYGSEILGIAGIAGSGQKELLDSIAGLVNDMEGSITFHNPKKNQPVTFFHKNLKQIKELAKENKFHYADGTPCNLNGKKNKEIIKMVNNGEILFYEDEIIDLQGKKPIEIRDLGIKLSFVPEDRLGMGLVGDMDMVDNMMLRSYRKGRGVFLHRDKPEALAKRLVKELDIKTPDVHTKVRKLSGGNVQKILVGRELSSRPKVLMVAYPVRGLDINSSYLIYQLLDEQKRKGTAIMFVGEDLDVLMALSDRILVLSSGKVSGIVDPRVTSKEEIGLLMSKGRRKEGE